MTEGTIFISGGAGYIGSTAAEMLLDSGYQVTVYDALVTGHKAAIPQGAEFIHADLADSARLQEALQARKYDAVLHFAAFIEAGESMQNPGKFFHNNYVLSQRLIEACVKAGVKKFVLSSTAAVYASSDEPLSEESVLQPANVYGQTKRMIEETLEWYRRIYGLRYAALRYFNAAGGFAHRGEAHQPESHLIPLVLQVALGQRDSIKIFGNDYPTRDGTCVRDYIHISDLVNAHLLALRGLDERDHMIYNLGNGRGYSVREVIETARKVTGHAIPVEEIARRPGDAPRLVASSARIRAELGWQPQLPDLETIISSAWEWHRSHPNGYANS